MVRVGLDGCGGELGNDVFTSCSLCHEILAAMSCTVCSTDVLDFAPFLETIEISLLRCKDRRRRKAISEQ